MKPIFLVTLTALMSLCARARAEDHFDLRPIQHKFVELGVKEERLYITNTNELENFWRRFSKDPVPNTVDFKENNLIIFLMGTKPSGGYFAKIESVAKLQRHLTADNVIQVILCQPPSDEAQIAEVTSPYAVKVIPKTQGQMIWKTRQQQSGKGDCKN